jgi:putative phosphoesterase
MKTRFSLPGRGGTVQRGVQPVERGDLVRIGIVSDVHGNTDGLLCALDRMGDVDELLCVGDVVEEFRFCNEAVAVLRDRDARCVLGNHDLGLLSAHGERARNAAHVDQRLVAWLAAQPHTIDTHVGGKRLVMTHASPCAPFTQYVLPHSAELRRLREVEADFVVIGHTHKQMVQRVGRPLVINPGSVGQARDHSNGKRLSYAVLDAESDHVTFDDYTTDERDIPQGQPTLAALCGAGGQSDR